MIHGELQRTWTAPEIAPPAAGRYERLTPRLGVTVDVWDAELCAWRRCQHGVICANQGLPWRHLP